MQAGVPRETAAGETRVGAVPETVRRLRSLGLAVAVEAGAGREAFLDDSLYEQAGATIAADAVELYGRSELILKVAPPSPPEEALLGPGKVLVSLLDPSANAALMERLAAAGVTSFAMDAVPRITRAQPMDALSSMATLAGYKAALLAAGTLGKIAPMMMTAAGTIRPATMLVIGAGVAGLTAVATARRLGAVVWAVDTRPVVAEQVESLGARFVSLEVAHEAQDAGGYAADLGEAFYAGEQEVLAPHVAAADMVVTTALIPGRGAPVLITEAMVRSMQPGSVIVDLAAAAGGNCTLTRPDERVEAHGVTIFGPTNLPAELPVHASQMYARNVAAFVGELAPEGAVRIDPDNEILSAMLVTHEGRLVGKFAPTPAPEEP